MARSKALKRKSRRNWLKILVTICILCIVGNMLVQSELFSSFLEMAITARGEYTIPISEEWNLIVVNQWNEIPEDYSVTLTDENSSRLRNSL